MTTDSYDLAVVGGGIAGLAVAEVFSRSGRNVLLIERNEHVCQEASASQHGWFHFGSLYSIFPQSRFLRTLIGGVEDLLDYYVGFPGMNIECTDSGRLSFPESTNAWFRDEPLEYIVSARNDLDFDMRAFDGVREYCRKTFFLATWEIAIKQFISRHQRFHKHNWRGTVPASQWIPRAGFSDYSRAVITKPKHPDINLDVDTHFRIVGYDRPMRATVIVTDLVRSLLGSGGSIRTGAEVESVVAGKGCRTVRFRDGSYADAKTIIFATGRSLGRFVEPAVGLNVIASPLLVTYPAVSELNFVRMTPFVETSVNHLHHQVDGNAYSLIGGGYYANPNDPAAVAQATERLRAMAASVFARLRNAQILESYLGFKTEFASGVGKRNYQYFIRELAPNSFAVIPGKFSLAFSLAANLHKLVTGSAPCGEIRLAAVDEAHRYVSLTRHARIIRDALRSVQQSGFV